MCLRNLKLLKKCQIMSRNVFMTLVASFCQLKPVIITFYDWQKPLSTNKKPVLEDYDKNCILTFENSK